MTTETPYGSTHDQTGTTTGRSPEYADGLTAADTTSAGVPRTATRALGASAFAGSGDGLGDRGRDLGDNRDGLGRDRTDALTAEESGTLIAADKVVGTAVYDAAGERLGTIDSIMLNKRSGRVAYAVMSFGGFLGIGERYHPLPWNALTYDEAKGGYNVEHSADDLRRAPNYSRDEVDTLDYARSGGEIDNYYGVEIADGAAAEVGIPARASFDPITRRSTGIVAADDIGSTTGAGSSGMLSTGMGSNRNL